MQKLHNTLNCNFPSFAINSMQTNYNPIRISLVLHYNETINAEINLIYVCSLIEC